DDVIDTMRGFDPETQRSLDKVEAVRMLPGREVPLDEASVARAMDALRERFDIDTRRSALFQDLKSGHAPAGIEYYLPLFFDRTATLFDYLADGTLPLVAAGVAESADHFWKQTGERHEQRRHDIERPLLAPDALYLPPDALRERLNAGERIEVCGPQHPRHAQAAALGDQPAPELPLVVKDAQPAAALKSFLASYPGHVLVAADTAGRREALLEVLHASDLRPEVLPDFQAFLLPWREATDADSAESGLSEPPSLRRTLTPAPLPGGEGLECFAVAVAPFDDGFALDADAAGGVPFAVLTERQLFPERASQPRRRKRAGREPEAIIRDLGELTEGSPIVHEDHGVGRYRGLVTLEAGGQAAEYLEIEYAKGDRLYVPVAQLHLVSRYSGASPETAPLHSLGGEQWTKARRKAAEKVRDVAAELLEIQARRQARAGLAIDVDRAMYEPFAAT